jgi:hypothetical protein
MIILKVSAFLLIVRSRISKHALSQDMLRLLHHARCVDAIGIVVPVPLTATRWLIGNHATFLLATTEASLNLMD